MVGVFKCQIYLCGLPVLWIIGALISVVATVVCECMCPHLHVCVGVEVGVFSLLICEVYLKRHPADYSWVR